MQVTFDMIRNAADVIGNVTKCTPIVTSSLLNSNLYIKAECLQKTGSFKLRGAYNKISHLTEEECRRGIVACSSGNHAQGVAFASSKRGVKSVIYMSEKASIQKINATKTYGGEVVLVPGVYDDAAREAAKACEQTGSVFVHPFNDPFVIAGQGTVGLEITEQVPDAEQIIVPIGGGGLISGISLAVKTVNPSCKIIGVQATSVPSMYGSVAAGKIITVNGKNTLADGIHVLSPGDITFNMVNRYVDDVVTVSEKEIINAMVSTLVYSKLVSEGAGATSVAAFLSGKVNTNLKTVCVVSGGNVDVSTIEKVINLSLS